MNQSKEICCLCLTALCPPYVDLFEKNTERDGTSHFDKISSLNQLAKIFEDNIDCIYKLCGKCCDTIDLVYRFNLSCLQNVGIYINHKKLSNRSIKIEKETEENDLIYENIPNLEDDENILDHSATEDIHVKEESAEEHLKIILEEGKTEYHPEDANTKQSQLFVKIKPVNNVKKKYKCKICRKPFSEKVYLKLHLRNNHSDVSLFTCKICKKSFTTKTNLNIHMKNHSGDEGDNSDIPKKSTKFDEDEEEETDEEEKLFYCNECDIEFMEEDDFAIHKQTHDGRPHICNFCRKGFTKKSDLTKHVRIHTGERPFPCLICNKAFITKSHLNRHVSGVHSKEVT